MVLGTLVRGRCAVIAGVFGAVALLACGLSGCAGPGLNAEAPLTPPTRTGAPYGAESGGRATAEKLFAVLPLRNETGVSSVDHLAFSDKVVAALEEVDGVRAVPLNRTLETMRALKIAQITSPADARRIGQAMGVDGVVLGAITAWDPYDPVIGVSLALYAPRGTLTLGATEPEPGLDPRELSRRATEPAPSASNFGTDQPLNVVSEHLDGKDHGVLTRVKDYAGGRHDPSSALGWRRYVKSMELYQQFAAADSVSRLMAGERARLGVGRSPAGVGAGSDAESSRESVSDNRPGSQRPISNTKSDRGRS